MGVHAENEIVTPGAAGEVFAGVIEDMIGAEGTCGGAAGWAADGGDLGAEGFGDLDGECAHAAGGTIDENGLAGLDAAVIAKALKGGDGRHGDGGGGIEGEVGPDAVEPEAEGSDELSSFEHGFRVGRAEGMIALVDAMTEALGPAADIDSRSEEATTRSSRLDADIANFFVGKTRPSILVVDDEAINIDPLADTFEVDYEVLAATDGKTALETAQRERPDLILLDVMMPGIDGYEVRRRLKGNRETQNIPVIFVTALGGGADEIRGLELGAQDDLTKPIDPPSVRARVNNQVKLKYAQDKLLRLASLEQTRRENLLRWSQRFA